MPSLCQSVWLNCLKEEWGKNSGKSVLHLSTCTIRILWLASGRNSAWASSCASLRRVSHTTRWKGGQRGSGTGARLGTVSEPNSFSRHLQCVWHLLDSCLLDPCHLQGCLHFSCVLFLHPALFSRMWGLCVSFCQWQESWPSAALKRSYLVLHLATPITKKRLAHMLLGCEI